MSDDSTRILDEGTADYPLDPAAATAEESCPHCQASIPVGEQFCPKCGFQRGSWREGEEAAGTPEPPVEARFALVAEDGTRYPLPDGESTVGRGDAGIRISDGYISRKHACFAVGDAGVAVTDLGSANGSFIGDEQLAANEPVELAVGATVKLGQTELVLEEEAPAAPEQPAEPAEPEADVAEPAAEETAAEDADAEKPELLAEAHLEVKPAGSSWSLVRTGTDEVLYLPFGETQLGRKPDKCDMVVRGDSYISGLHCRIVASLEHLEVTDLGSTNGTYINDERLAPDKTAGLSEGDTLRIGSTDLTVSYEPAAATEDQPASDDEAADEEPDPAAD